MNINDASNLSPTGTPLYAEEWESCRAGLNVLLIGDDRATGALVERLKSERRTPISEWHPGEAMVLPRGRRERTLIFHEVGALRPEMQRQLFVWLERHLNAQIIGTSAIPLFPLVRSGAFLEGLYYRLNTVCLEIGERPQAH